MKRFWLFGNSRRAHYAGGMLDFIAAFDTVEEALAPQPAFVEKWLDWMHVADSTTGKVVATREQGEAWLLRF